MFYKLLLTFRRIDMVPELLSSNLCSLRGNEERFAFSCVWKMTKDAEILSTRFHKSIIRSRAAMTYEMAQNKIDDPEDNDALAVSLRHLLRLSKIMKRRRVERGALVLASSEVRFDVDSETADPIDVQARHMTSHFCAIHYTYRYIYMEYVCANCHVPRHAGQGRP